MSVLMVPPPDKKPWPTLGPYVCDFLEERCVHGPGDLAGQPFTLDEQARALIYRQYEIFPRNNARAGKRRFKRVTWSLRKGVAKTERAAAVLYAELHPEAPVRCDGWKREGNAWVPVGRPVTNPYIPMVAFTEAQADELAFGALSMMCTDGPDSMFFDVTLERIIRIGANGRADGKAESLATAPDAADGARTTCQHFDEGHRLSSERQVHQHQTMLQNIPKRPIADAWTFMTSTTYEPGEGSILESEHEEAEEAVKNPKAADRTFLFFHREAAPRKDEDLDDVDQLKAAIREASGQAIADRWEDFEGQVEAIAGLYPQAKKKDGGAYFERVWLNRRVASSKRAFDKVRWRDLGRDVPVPGKGEAITLGFDGSRWRDTTALIATHVLTGLQWPVDIWVPDEHEGEIPRDLVGATIADCFERFYVVRLYGDPASGWIDPIADWSNRWGKKRVFEWFTDSRGLKSTAYMLQAYDQAMRSAEVTHVVRKDNALDEILTDHIGNANRKLTSFRDDEDQPLWLIMKERNDSPNKIDGAMAGALSWQARLDALTAGDSLKPVKENAKVSSAVYTFR
jgi:hypothetical protein